MAIGVYIDSGVQLIGIELQCYASNMSCVCFFPQLEII